MSAFEEDQTPPKDPALQFLDELMNHSPNDPLPVRPVHEREPSSYMPPEYSQRTESPLQDGFPESPFPNDSTTDELTPPPSLQSSLAARAQLVKLLKQNKKFSRDSIKDLDNFAAVSSCFCIPMHAHTKL